jgi:hypothetical protein
MRPRVKPHEDIFILGSVGRLANNSSCSRTFGSGWSGGGGVTSGTRTCEHAQLEQ